MASLSYTLPLLLAAAVLAAAETNAVAPPHLAVIHSSCKNTLYPDLCVSAAVDVADSAVRAPKDVIELSLNLTVAAVEKNRAAISKLAAASSGLTAREKTALGDCLEVIEETLDELRETYEELGKYPSSTKSVAEVAEDMETLVSAAMTNQDTCIDGFSHDGADRKVREALLAGQVHVFRMCSNVLAMIKTLTDTDIARLGHRRSTLGDNEGEWPKWVSAADRRLLQAATVTADVTVAADGSGNYRTVSEAVSAAPERSTKRYVIRIKAGVYRENVDVSSRKTYLMFVGDGQSTTIITAGRNVVDGSTTFDSATVAVVGDDFLARDITFQNSAGPTKHQAVALRVGSDRSAFYRCGMIAYQDTLYVHTLRQFYVKCYVAGTVDFIFGNAAVVLQDCDIHARLPSRGQRNMVTAQGRDDPNQNTGIVIQKCRIGATSDLVAAGGTVESYLGRPWKTYSRTVVMQTAITDVIHPAGWYPWDGSFALSTLYYGEYKNTGAGSGTSGRVSWAGFKVITSSAEAQMFTPENFIGGSSWLGSTGFPYSLGL